MASSQLTALQIPCCLCGTMIHPNAANQCNTCLAQEFDLQSKVARGPGGSHEIKVFQCRKCRRFQQTEKSWLHVEPESQELLSICLKRLPALNNASGKGRVQLVDAMWVWTEPHSMRLKLRLTVRADHQNVQIQQRVLVELKIEWKQCPDCNREFTNRTWHALVQLRQKRDDDAPKKGLVALEMALARNADVRKHVLSIDTTRNGFDFYFLNLHEAQSFASYLARVAPMRIKTSQKMVSADAKNNTANMKHTVTCDLVPLCRDDLIIIHKNAKGGLSGRMALVTKVSSVVHLVDAAPKRSPTVDGTKTELSPETYYKGGGDKLYPLVQTSARLTRFIVMDVELCSGEDVYGSSGNVDDKDETHANNRGLAPLALADVEVARESEFGCSQDYERLHCVTHLGNLLQPGDVVLGYDLATLVLSGGAEFDMDKCFQSAFVMPDVVLVKKVKDKIIEKEETNGDAPDETSAKSKGRMSKRKERRNKRNEKKARELEETAVRMGFLQEDEKDYMNDPELVADLEEIEKDLAAISLPEEEQDETPSDTKEAATSMSEIEENES